jgi:hypothetical protein
MSPPVVEWTSTRGERVERRESLEGSPFHLAGVPLEEGGAVATPVEASRRRDLSRQRSMPLTAAPPPPKRGTPLAKKGYPPRC